MEVWNLVKDTFLLDMQKIIILTVLLFMAMGANTILGVNKSKITDTFSKEYLLNSLKYNICFVIGLMFLVAAISLAIPILEYYDIVLINSSVMETINVLAIAGLIATGIFKYGYDALIKVTEFIGIHKKNTSDNNGSGEDE